MDILTLKMNDRTLVDTDPLSSIPDGSILQLYRADIIIQADTIIEQLLLKNFPGLSEGVDDIIESIAIVKNPRDRQMAESVLFNASFSEYKDYMFHPQPKLFNTANLESSKWMQDQLPCNRANELHEIMLTDPHQPSMHTCLVVCRCGRIFSYHQEGGYGFGQRPNPEVSPDPFLREIFSSSRQIPWFQA